ncbi:MAG: ParA family protein [Phycisphaerae bacterium]|nr:ParA family protein [Phycisphaerae bacterium]MBT5408816.1 ParA family protein [Phycisphaerae bacterium]MBT6164991.1 ParA family protein [Phycisphaerae bacterium]MBT7657425.1 ParA family protein [Phycisphaerae bacterium]
MSKARIISILNQKGGVGKTTTTVNLAAALAASGNKVLVIDLDPQTHLGLHFGVESDSASVYDLLMEDGVSVQDALLFARENIDLVTSEVDLAAAESELASKTDRHDLLSRKLEPIADSYEYILIDCPPSLGLLTINALAASKELIVPMQTHFLALQGVSRLFETVQMLVGGLNPELQVSGIVLCMHEKNTKLAREVVDDLQDFFDSSRDSDVPWRDCIILDPPIRRNVKLAEAPSFGQTIFDYEPDCAGAKDYRQLAQSVVAADPSKRITVEIEVKNEQQGTPEAGPIHNDKN